MAKQVKTVRVTTKKVTSIGDGVHSRPNRKKGSTRKKYRGQGK